MKKKTVLIAIAAMLLICMSGCESYDRLKTLVMGNINQTVENVTENASNDAVTNTITVGMYDFDTFNPLTTTSATVKEAMEFIYEPMFALNEQLKPEPVLANDYGMSADGKTIVINLKDNVSWHDGVSFSAYDVAYTIRQIRSEKTTYTNILNDMSDYSVTGDHQLTVSFNHPIPNAAALFTFPIVKYQTDMDEKDTYTPIGTGPFAFSGKISTDRYMLNAFDYYYGGKAKLDGVYIDVSPDAEKYIYMYSSGAFDVATSDMIDLKTYTPKGGVAINEAVGNKLTFIGLNHSKPEIWGADTRIALSYLTDRENIVSAIQYSRTVGTDIPVNPSSWLYAPLENSLVLNEKAAEEHLKIDGWSAKEMGGYSRSVNGQYQELTFELLVNSESDEKLQIAKKMADVFNMYGIKTAVVQLPYEQYIQRINAKQYDMFIGEYEMPATQDLTVLLNGSGNFFNYRNDTVDALMTQIGMTSNEEELKALYAQLAEIFRGEMPFIPISYDKECTLSSAKLKNVQTPGAAGFYRQTWNWSVK